MDVHPVHTCLPRVHPLRRQYLFCHHEYNFSCPVWCWNHHISQIFNCIWNNLDYWPRKDTWCVCSCVCVCKSMTVNGRNPSTNPHLSSWITDIINRRDSSISPVFPIQRWGAGLFPSLSADLMTFTKLLYMYRLYAHARQFVCEYACISVHVWVTLKIALFWMDSLFVSQRSWLFSSLAVISVGSHADPQPSTEGQRSSWGVPVGRKRKWNKRVDKSEKPAHMKKR